MTAEQGNPLSEARAEVAYAAAFCAAGRLQCCNGGAAAIGQVLTTDARGRKFTITGSTSVGKLLAARCAGTVERVSLELGGNAPFIVSDDADLGDAVAAPPSFEIPAKPAFVPIASIFRSQVGRTRGHLRHGPPRPSERS